MTSWNGGSGPPACITASRLQRLRAGCSSTAGAIRAPGSSSPPRTATGQRSPFPWSTPWSKPSATTGSTWSLIDPFISTHQVPENDNNAIDEVAKTWTTIADITDTAIDLAHHTRKTGGAEVTVEDGRGAVALLNAVRPARVLNVMTEDEALKAGIVDGRRRYFKVTDGKNNLALPLDRLDWFRSEIDLPRQRRPERSVRPGRRYGRRHQVGVAQRDGRDLRRGLSRR